MKNKLTGGVTLFLCFFAAFSSAQTMPPCDPKATTETRNLYTSMQRIAGSGIMFGHHDDTAYGVNWHFQDDSSDVKGVTGSYPAVYGWDLAKIEHDSLNDINGTAFKLQKKLVKDAYQRGGINTFCWHMDNPVNGHPAWDTTRNSVKDILPGGPFHEAYLQYLDRAARYIKSLKGDDGEAIPILFRPFHELTGSWFWWGTNTSSPEDFVALWRFTVDYLRKTQKVHNMLIVFSAADFNTEEDYLSRYPGDEYVDFTGFDIYCNQSIPDYVLKLDKQLAVQQQVADDHHKLAVIAETGYEGIPDTNWWTSILLPELSKYPLSYVLTWRNANTSHYFAPYAGQASAADFVKFYKSPKVMFQTRLSPMGIYGKTLKSPKGR